MIMERLIQATKLGGSPEDVERLKEFKVFDLNNIFKDLLILLGVNDTYKIGDMELASRVKYRLPYPKFAGFYSDRMNDILMLVEETRNSKQFGIIGEAFDTLWITISFYAQIKGQNNVMHFLRCIAFPVTEEGRQLLAPSFWKVENMFSFEATGEQITDVKPNDGSRLMYFLLSAALLLLHSKYKVEETVKFSPNHAKKRAARGLPPAASYKILKVPSFLRPQKEETLEHWHVRLHDVRGHYKQQAIKEGHREIFIEPYQRGDALLGIVKKEYKVESPT